MHRTLLLTIIASGTTISAFQQPQMIDGSQTPDLIPDEHVYSQLLLTASTRDLPTDVEKRRSKAFLSNLPISVADQNVFASYATAYRQGSGIGADYNRTHAELSPDTISDLHKHLSIPGSAKLKEFVKSQRRYVKLFPVPAMNDGARNIINRLFSVQAQSMSYSSLYTNISVDLLGDVYATGTTNGTSSCGCHTVSADIKLTMPSGRQVEGAEYNASQIAQATTDDIFEDQDFLNGNLEAVTTHLIYCPYAHANIVNTQTSSINPLVAIYAYYYCSPRGGPCTLATNPMDGTKTYTENRCNPKTVCNTLYSRSNTWPYTLQHVAQITLLGTYLCIADKASAQQVGACGSPDPKP